MRAVPPRVPADALADVQRPGVEAPVELLERAMSPHTRRAYAMARRQLDAWLEGRPLDDASLAAYLGHLHEAGRAPASAAMVVATVKRSARDAGTAGPIGPLTRRALEGFRRTDAADAPPRRGQARGLTADECATVLATCLRPRRTGRGLEHPKTAERRGLVDGAIVALLFHGALRRSEVAALCWAAVDFGDGDDVVVTVRRSKSDPTGGRADVRRLVGGCASAVRSLHAAVSPEPGDAVVGLSVDQINRRFAAACAAAGLEGRRTSHGGRVGLAVELTARGASTHAIQLAGGWKNPAQVVRYAASISTREGAVSKYLR